MPTLSRASSVTSFLRCSTESSIAKIRGNVPSAASDGISPTATSIRPIFEFPNRARSPEHHRSRYWVARNDGIEILRPRSWQRRAGRTHGREHQRGQEIQREHRPDDVVGNRRHAVLAITNTPRSREILQNSFASVSSSGPNLRSKRSAALSLTRTTGMTDHSFQIHPWIDDRYGQIDEAEFHDEQQHCG